MMRRGNRPIIVNIPIKTGSGLNDRMHWRKRARFVRSERDTACMMVKPQLAMLDRSPLPAIVTITRHSAGTLDDDNLQGALKSVRDGIADALGVKDNDKRIYWFYRQAKCKLRDFGVTVEIV